MPSPIIPMLFTVMMSLFDPSRVAKLARMIFILVIGEVLAPSLLAQITDPLPEPVEFSGLVLEIETVWMLPNTSGHDDPPRPGRRAQLGDLKPAPNDPERLFLNDQRGPLYVLRDKDVSVYLNLKSKIGSAFWERNWSTGFANFAFHPAFPENGKFYTVHTEKSGSAPADFPTPIFSSIAYQAVVLEWTADDPSASTFQGTHRELIRVDIPQGDHSLAQLIFNPHPRPGDADYGKLYVGCGDGGSMVYGLAGNLQRLDSVLGTILRLDPEGDNSDNGQYGIPADNPWSNDPTPGIHREIWALGLRNPIRFSWDLDDPERMLISDVGERFIEEVNMGEAGRNYGWPEREGWWEYDREKPLAIYPVAPPDTDYTPPIAAYDHDEGFAISGGFVYRGAALPELAGLYFFGDIKTGRIFYIDLDYGEGPPFTVHEAQVNAGNGATRLMELIGYERVDLRWGTDHERELYLLIKRDATARRIQDTNVGRQGLIARKLGAKHLTPDEGWIFASGLGWVHLPEVETPWIYHIDWGWLYFAQRPHFWHPKEGWWMLPANSAPWIYSYKRESWIYPGTRDGKRQRWVYLFVTKEWILI